MSMSIDESTNLNRAEKFIRQAAQNGARLVLLPELFAGPYFCQTEKEEHFARAHAVEHHPFLGRFQNLAKELNVVLPISFFERAGQAHYNSIAIINEQGFLLGVYRKSHIPDGPFYEEKYYFNPGDTGFSVWPLIPRNHGEEKTTGKMGVGICWDQWYPEAARAFVLQGADVLLYPTAIGSEPPTAAEPLASLDTQPLWQRAMVGHAVCNAVYVMAPNRVGREGDMTFYGSSFICDYQGEILTQADKTSEVILYADLDFPAARTFRASMGFFRDRRPDLYQSLLGYS
jgi:N-carbamoylputrescine amidase